MKKLRTLFCILLSGLTLLLAGGCVPQIYKDTKSDEFVSFNIFAHKTTCVGADETIEVECSVTTKTDIWLTGSFEYCIYAVALSEEYSKGYYGELFYKVGIYKLEDALCDVNANVDIVTRLSFHEANVTYKRSMLLSRFHNDNFTATKGKYRIYFIVQNLFTEDPRSEEGLKAKRFLYPTDIVLNMK